jgi:hypothetical protein
MLPQTSWALLGPGVEVGLVAPNIMKSINILMANVIKDFSYNYDRIIQVLWKKGNKKKKIFILKVFEMMPHGTLKFQIPFWALRPASTKERLWKETIERVVSSPKEKKDVLLFSMFFKSKKNYFDMCLNHLIIFCVSYHYYIT